MRDRDRHHRRGYHHGRLKDALIEAAIALIGERGLSGFTLTDAAKRVGVTAAAPYRHFSDRQALMTELAKRGFEQFGARLQGAWDDGKPDPVIAFRRMGFVYLAFAREEPGLYQAMFENAGAITDPAAADTASRAFLMLARAAAAILEPQGGTMADANKLAYEVWALTHGAAMLMIANYVDSARAGADPRVIVDDGAIALIEAAVARVKARKSAT